jgi:hypothetical protein
MKNILENRFDIKIKLLYLQDKEKWGYMYFYHLLLWGGGRIYEWDNPNKSSYDDFLTSFDITYQSLKESGWKGDPVRCIELPNGDIYPIEGAHRIASCLHLGIEPEIVIIKGQQCQLWNADFFRNIGMLESEIKKVQDAG